MMIAVGIASASCKKVESVPSESTEGSTFALNASIQQTKTTINGLEVNWENNDVLYLVTTDGTWGKPYSQDTDGATIAEYTYSSDSFTSEATIANGTYTFNALYDGSASQKSFHRGASTTYSLQSIQTQDCLNPTGHLKDNDALVGTFTAKVPMEKPASVNMSHIFAIMRVDVKNATGKDVELKSFEMSAAEATLAGIFTVNFTNSPIDITEKPSKSSSSSIKVNLTNGTVASCESLPVYFVMAPLSGYSGDVTFTVVDADDKVYSKTVPLSNITFSAGSLNTTPYKITEGVALTCYTWDLSKDSTSEANADKIAWTNSVADMVCTKGEGGTAANNYYPGTSGKNYSSTRFYSKSTLSITPKDEKSLTYYVFEATSEGYATALANSTWTNAGVVVNGKTVTVIANDPSVAVSAQIGATCGFTMVECHTDALAPIIRANPTNINNVPATGEICTINYSIDFPVDGKSISASSDQNWVNTFDYSKSGEISFVVDENTEDARTANITLSYEGAEDVIVPINQNATGAVPETEIEIEGNFSTIENGLSLECQGITITQLKENGNAPNSNYAKATTLRVYVGNTLTFSSDKTITKIVLTHGSSYSGGSLTTADVGTYSRGSTSSTWTGSSKKVVITNTKGTEKDNIQIRPTKIVVTVLNDSNPAEASVSKNQMQP